MLSSHKFRSMDKRGIVDIILKALVEIQFLCIGLFVMDQ